MSQKTMINDLTIGSVPKKLMVFALPLMLSSLLQTIYNIVDMIIVGQFVGRDGLSAVSIGGELLGMIVFFIMGFCGAGQVIISQYAGARNHRSVSQTIGTMFTAILSSSLVLSVISILLLNTVLDLMNTPVEARQYAWEYCMICFAGLFFIFGYNIVSSILRGMGDSRHPFLFIAIAATANLILDLVFIVGFGWEVFGAALATVIGQGISFIVSILFLYKKRLAFGFDFKPASFAINKAILKQLVMLGLPMALQHAAITFSMLFVNSFINSYGVVASAVTGIGSKLGGIANVVTGSLGIASSTMIGQSLGAGRYERVPRIIRTSLIIGLVVSAVLSLITLLFPEAVFGIFNSDPEVLELAMTFVPTAILLFASTAVRSPYWALINGLGHARLSLITGLLDGVVARIGLAMLLGITFGMGIRGFWYGSALAGFVPFFIGAAYYFSGRWRTHRLIIDVKPTASP